MRVLVLLGVLLLAGCAEKTIPYDASFEAVAGESGKYTLKVLNATLGNVTVEVAAPSRPSAVVPREDEGVVSVTRPNPGLVVLELVVDRGVDEAPSTIPTWTFRLDGLRRNTYTVDALVTTRVCGAECQRIAEGEVRNTVKVT